MRCHPLSPTPRARSYSSKGKSQEAMRVAEMLSNIYHSTCREVRYPGLSASAAGKVAMFLLNQVDDDNKDKNPDPKEFALSHEEIANRIGASRETVTRLFATFKRRKLIGVHGSILVVLNRIGLQTLVDA